MSSPFSQHNQQPFQPQPGMGGYPQQGGYPQGGNQQGGYQQQGGYPQQAAQPSYGASPYGQPAYAGGPMGPQPSGSNSGKLIAIIAGSFIAALVIGGIIMLIFRIGMSTSQEDRSASPSPTSSSSPSYGSKPTSKPSSSPTYGSKPSPTSGSGTGTGSNGGSDPAVENMIKSTCDSQIYTAIKGASITNQELFLINTSSDKLTYAYTGHVTGRLAKTNEAVDSDFTCKADYDLSSGLIETHFE
jgi:hypothetical protein